MFTEKLVTSSYYNNTCAIFESTLVTLYTMDTLFLTSSGVNFLQMQYFSVSSSSSHPHHHH